MGTSRYTRIDPETGWEETWEREHGEGGWMLVSTSPPKRDHADDDRASTAPPEVPHA